MNSILISAIASNQGKTLLTTALLYYYKNSVRPFKIGPDYIDPLFHKKICHTDSINLDTFIMNEQQVLWLFNHYSNKKFSILEGVMGFYDGMDKNCSAYNIGKLLDIPTLLILDGSGSYITISAVLKGLKTYKKDNTIKAVVLNKLSSSMHFELIKTQIEKDFNDIEVLGWIKKDLPTLKQTHLGLDLNFIDNQVLEMLSKEVLENINLQKLEELSFYKKKKEEKYPFASFSKIDKKVAIINDENFCFLYYDNLKFFKELFLEVEIINPTKDEEISEDTHLVFIPGGYVETQINYNRIKDKNKFKNSLLTHIKNKKYVYAECAGLLYLSKSVDDKKMSEVLDVEFILTNKRVRLGYYYSENGLKGHAFHYTKPKSLDNAIDILSKNPNLKAQEAAWKKDKVYGTYLHTMFRNNLTILKDYFGI